MPTPRRRLPRELFETRSHTWHSLGLGDELAPRFSKEAFGGLLLALIVLAPTRVVASRSKKSNPTPSSCGSTRPRCDPRTARSWPRRCWRRCGSPQPVGAAD